MNSQELNFSRLLHLTAHAWRQAIDRRMKDNGLSMSSWMAVATIAIQETPISQKELAQALGLEDASVVPLIDRLVKQQLVERIQPEEDRRKRLLHVTPQGETLYQRLKVEADALRNELLANVDKDDLAVTQRVLQQLLIATEGK
ncbi:MULTISPECIES: MarR family winged helix-turn-helix transcriptional regulator [Erwiniaceae]|uniref:MarR family transcriptional regulator n=1 Tax=Pantoea coffeiphila TaxID=1465635 RepID=A0A2S9ICS4_9GAMM|nr:MULTISPECIES: MarR family transcriptional regulator [Erwiniaceae]MBK0003192.1 MarR family transcriptional regulator [Erwinia sp. S38]MBM7342280.1 MarR family transcriptional regulator for hemolysin [Pantoea coffeiphila]PRD15593.1 MarR family transcriptional regulator [Pantoea coffeiphila]